MPNTDSTGKQGRSMDASQFLDIKKKRPTVSLEHGKDIPGDQSQKPMFNRDFKNGGNSDNGASWFYNQRGLVLLYQRRTLF